MNLDLIGETRTKKYLLQDAIYDLIKEFEEEAGAQVTYVGVQHIQWQPSLEEPKWFLDRVQVEVKI